MNATYEQNAAENDFLVASSNPTKTKRNTMTTENNVGSKTPAKSTTKDGTTTTTKTGGTTKSTTKTDTKRKTRTEG